MLRDIPMTQVKVTVNVKGRASVSIKVLAWAFMMLQHNSKWNPVRFCVKAESSEKVFLCQMLELIAVVNNVRDAFISND